MSRATTTSPLGDDTLVYAAQFRAAMGGIPLTTWYRHLRAGLIPAAETRVGIRPAWRMATVRATIAKLIATGDPGVAIPIGKIKNRNTAA